MCLNLYTYIEPMKIQPRRHTFFWKENVHSLIHVHICIEAHIHTRILKYK